MMRRLLDFVLGPSLPTVQEFDTSLYYFRNRRMPEGRLLSDSKTMYFEQHPTHLIVFNANLACKSRGKFWYGDVDVERDMAAISALASAARENIYLLREIDTFSGGRINWKTAAAVFKPDGTVERKS